MVVPSTCIIAVGSMIIRTPLSSITSSNFPLLSAQRVRVLLDGFLLLELADLGGISAWEMASPSEEKLKHLLACIVEGVCKPVASSPLHAKL